MNDYLLFIDTEASGLPLNWALPYSADKNWPHAVQVSWIIYDRVGEQVKREDHYIKNDGFVIAPSATKLHGITNIFLAEYGQTREQVLQLLAADLLHYQPLVIGHFIRLDYYILSADFFRSGFPDPMAALPVFCTMMATKHLAWNPMPKHLKLGELYEYLFKKELKNQHNALNDAQATADCFYELLRLAEISEDYIAKQTAEFEPYRLPTKKPVGCVLPVLIVIALLIFMVWMCTL